jgi:hypothetical protein
MPISQPMPVRPWSRTKRNAVKRHQFGYAFRYPGTAVGGIHCCTNNNSVVRTADAISANLSGGSEARSIRTEVRQTKIAVAEDEPICCQALVRLCEPLGRRVDCAAANRAELVDYCIRHRFKDLLEVGLGNGPGLRRIGYHGNTPQRRDL